MAYRDFVIPCQKDDLLTDNGRNEYYVMNIFDQKELTQQLKNARTLLREEGAEYILTNFDIYFSVLQHGETVTMDVAFQAYQDLHRGVMQLNKALGFILEDKEALNDELKLKYVNIVRMLLYIYTRIILLIEDRHAQKRNLSLKTVKKSTKNSKSLVEDFVVNKKDVLLILYNIIERDISYLWENEVVEENVISIVSNICYTFLENPAIKKEKEEFMEIFNVLGHLIQHYNHGKVFVSHITELVKRYEHLTQSLPKGIQHLVQTFKFKGLLHDMVVDLTEWQISLDDRHPDNQGARHCGLVLSALASLMPDLMLPEVVALNKYLAHDPPSLRIAVVMVMTEVILNNLTSHELDDQQKYVRDELLQVLSEHIDDVSILVRAKVYQQWTRLQEESAIPLKIQNEIFSKISEHLYDKGVLARKTAATCVTTFLSCNAYSSKLSLSEMTRELDEKRGEFEAAKDKFRDPNLVGLLKLQTEWEEKVDKVKKVVEVELENGDSNDSEGDTENRVPADAVAEVIRQYLQGDSYKEAFKVCRNAIRDSEFQDRYRTEFRGTVDLDFYMNLLYTIFFDFPLVSDDSRNQRLARITKEDFAKLDMMSRQVDFLSNCVSFLGILDKSLGRMLELLETATLSDMNEAIEFFVAAYQFKIDRAQEGIVGMLGLTSEPDRKVAVVEAFRKIFLFTDTTNMNDHCTTIVTNLIRLVKSVPEDKKENLCDIVSNWTSEGILDISIIDMLWQHVLQKIQIPVEEEIICVELLRMAACGRKTIITSNIGVVTNIGFGKRGRENMCFLGACCRFLCVASEKVDIYSPTPPFRIKPTDQSFKDLVPLLTETFYEPVDNYHHGLYGGLDFIYKLCTKPEVVAEAIMKKVLPKFAKMQKEQPDGAVPDFVISRICRLAGYIALRQMNYLDDTTYHELVRRRNVRDERKKDKKKTAKEAAKKKKEGQKSATGAVANSSRRATQSFVSASGNDTVLEGADAEDTDAEFILHVLENDIVNGSGSLGKLAPFLLGICQRPDVFATQELQFTAMTALMRYMLVSSRFCKEHLKLVFTVLEKTEYDDVKTSVLVHVSDMLTRFPNVVDPWVPRLFQCLKDPSPKVRRDCLYTLSNIILRDMIRANPHIPKMAACLSDDDDRIKFMAKSFFDRLTQKENNLYNLVPDILTHLLEELDDDDAVKDSMRVLFEVAESPKHLDHVVARFCSKFKLTEDGRQHRVVSYCLGLLKYNEKALRRLVEEFPSYKHLLHDEEVYGNFKLVMQGCNRAQPVGKADLKPLVEELDKLIKSVFQLDNSLMPPPAAPRASKKQRKPRKATSKKAKKKKSSEDSDDSD